MQGGEPLEDVDDAEGADEHRRELARGFRSAEPDREREERDREERRGQVERGRQVQPGAR